MEKTYRKLEDAQIEKIILHELDNKKTEAKYSSYELENFGDFEDLLIRYINLSLIGKKVRVAWFNEKSKVKAIADRLFEDNTSFIEQSKELSEDMFTIMKANKNISPANFLIAIIKANNSRIFCILKLDFSKIYRTVYRKLDDNTYKVELDKLEDVLPSSEKDIQKAAFYWEELKDKLKDSNKKDFHLILLDRQTRENTKLDITQFFQSYLNCDIIKEDSDFTKEFYDKTREFFNDNGLIGKYDRIRKLLEERENININSVADELFEEDEEIKGKYKEFIFKTVHNDDFEIDKSWVEENFKKRVLKTSDNSITIVINGNQLEDKNKIIIKKTDDNDKKVDLTIKNVILEDKR